MLLNLTAEERAHVYAFVGGLTYVGAINREKRRHLAKLANKFGPNATKVTLNQTNLFFLNSLLFNAVKSGEKASNNAETTAEQKEQIAKVNVVFNTVLDKINKKNLNKQADKGLGMVLGSPKLKLGDDVNAK